MPTYKSKVEAEERRDYWLHRGEIERAQDAVVKTGLAWWRSGYDDPQKGEEFDAACATLAKLMEAK